MFSFVKMVIKHVLLLCLCIATKHYEVDGWGMPNFNELDLEKQLKIINKPPIKTIQTEFGSTVDCIDINKQPAFDHPSLKNHKIQLKPSFEDTITKVDVSHESAFKIGLSKDLCPKGTVPIQRTTKEDLIRANNIGTGIFTRTALGTHIAELRLNYNEAFFGIQGSFSTYNPPVANGQMSEAYIWLSNGTSLLDTNTVLAGWQVYPDLANDTKTHFVAGWYDSIIRTGCYNMLCPGFVQISQTIFPGLPVSNVSTFNGPQFEMNLNITKDLVTNNWWLKAQNINVGYFPAEIFCNFTYANNGGWTGQTSLFYGNNDISPPMGSGHFPDGNPQHAAYISRIEFQDGRRQLRAPLRGEVWSYADNPICYGVTYYDYVDDNLQRVLMFGGPGGDCSN